MKPYRLRHQHPIPSPGSVADEVADLEFAPVASALLRFVLFLLAGQEEAL